MNRAPGSVSGRGWGRLTAPETALAPLLALGACAGFEPPDEAALARVRAAAMPVPEAGCETCDVTICSAQLSGKFTAVLASERAGRVRLQLFPDVGGKILDLWASSERIRGTIPQAGVQYDAAAGGDPPRHVLLFFAITLLERSTPLEPARVRGVRGVPERGRAFELLLEPRVPGTEVVAEIDEHGALVARRYSYRHVSWRERLGPTTRVSASGFELEARVAESTELRGEERAAAFGPER